MRALQAAWSLATLLASLGCVNGQLQLHADTTQELVSLDMARNMPECLCCTQHSSCAALQVAAAAQLSASNSTGHSSLSLGPGLFALDAAVLIQLPANASLDMQGSGTASTVSSQQA